MRTRSAEVRERREERRVKRVSVGICRRDWVAAKILNGEKGGKVRIKKVAEIMKRMRRFRAIVGGSGMGLRL